MSSFLLFYSLFFVWIPTFAYPPSHRLLQTKNIYSIALGVAILLILLTIIMLFNEPLTPIEKSNSLMSLSPLTFLLLYKKVNQRSMRKYNRPIYFTTKYGQDKETRQSNWSEMLLQFLFAFIPFVYGTLGLWIFER
ncbi:MAG: hypothetical protein LBI72_00245 [Flavobacteriaceae bacterium]|jgi:hypothetical protein|nr:hypothetical protein [Flavobacteriaceae bacterium]